MDTNHTIPRFEPTAMDRPLDGAQSTATTSKGHILIVDDVRENRDILKRRFERHGFRATEADGGLPALELLERETFDLVLLDMMMPDMSGLDVLTHIRARQSAGAL